MERSDREIITSLVLMLDASIEALDAAAALERKREAGKALRQITWQERANNARKLVREAADRFDIRGVE